MIGPSGSSHVLGERFSLSHAEDRAESSVPSFMCAVFHKLMESMNHEKKKKTLWRHNMPE